MLLPRWVAIVSFVFLGAGVLSGASLSILVIDPKGAAVPGAAVTAEGESAVPLKSATGDLGQARFDSIPPAKYRLSIVKEGFETWQRTVTVGDKPVDVNASLTLAVLTTTVQVSARRSALANSDPNYIALRGGKLTKVYKIDNLVLKRDVATFTFRSGSFSFLPPVLGEIAVGVFVGDGNFKLTPAYGLAATHLHRMAGMDAVDEDFGAMVVYFTDSTFGEVQRHSEIVDESAEKHEEAFKRVKRLLETRREPPSPLMRNCCPPLRKTGLTLLERLLSYEDIPNYDAEILAELYNPAQRGSFRAFLHGKKFPGLQFLLNPRGAMPMLPAPEEIALLDFDPDSDLDGIWYLSHFANELASGSASSNEDKRLIAPLHYGIQALIGKENVLGKQSGITVTCDLEFRSLEDGTRMVKFDLVPDLQMTRVRWDGKEIPFIQENRKQDGSFYLQSPEPLMKGRTYKVGFEYSGGEIIQSDFGAIPPRRVWYPTPSGAGNRATYDLKFLVPRGTTVASVGERIAQSRQGSYDASEWTSRVPLKQAVFRHLEDSSHRTGASAATDMKVDIYVHSTGNGLTAPGIGSILTDTGSLLQLFANWFGRPAYDGLSVVVASGVPPDSLPGIVLSPPALLAGYSSLVSQINVRTNGMAGGLPGTLRTTLDEAFAEQIAAQWWGNTVAPATFHDVWLSSGFANFSSSIFDAAAKTGEYKDHWEAAHRFLLSKNEFGVRSNDAGPVWMGLLNETRKTERVSGPLAAYKGGYILQMLRSMMWDPKTGDADFQSMMQDYVKQFTNRPVSTADFQGVVEKHMKPVMDIQRNGRMDWFFREWVFGTDVPSYGLEYTLTPEQNGKTLLTAKLTQSGVSPDFVMPVPLYAQFSSTTMRLTSATMIGNTSGQIKVRLSQRPKRVVLNLNHDVLADREEAKQIKVN